MPYKLIVEYKGKRQVSKKTYDTKEEARRDAKRMAIPTAAKMSIKKVT